MKPHYRWSYTHRAWFLIDLGCSPPRMTWFCFPAAPELNGGWG